MSTKQERFNEMEEIIEKYEIMFIGTPQAESAMYKMYKMYTKSLVNRTIVYVDFDSKINGLNCDFIAIDEWNNDRLKKVVRRKKMANKTRFKFV